MYAIRSYYEVYQTDDEVEMLLYFVVGCALAVAVAGGRIAPGVRDYAPNETETLPHDPEPR